MTHPAPVRAVVFDFDGVLVDSEPMHEEAILRAVRPRGWTFTRERFVAEIVGRGDERAMHTIAAWHGHVLAPGEADALLAAKRSEMDGLIRAGRFAVQPGAVELVQAAAAKRPVAVCSGSRRAVVAPMLEKIGLAPVFRTLVTADDVERPKPHPDGYALACGRLGVAPGEAVAIEDTPTGVAAARAAGMRVVAIACTVPAEALREADEVVPTIRDLRLARLVGPE